MFELSIFLNEHFLNDARMNNFYAIERYVVKKICSKQNTSFADIVTILCTFITTKIFQKQHCVLINQSIVGDISQKMPISTHSNKLFDFFIKKF